MYCFYQAIISHKSFLPFIYPEIKDKLSSDLIQAKHDSIELFTEIVKKYEVTVTKDYLKDYMPLFITTYSDRNNKGVLGICEESIQIITESIMKLESIYIYIIILYLFVFIIFIYIFIFVLIYYLFIDPDEYITLFITPIIDKCIESINTFAHNDITDITIKIIIIISTINPQLYTKCLTILIPILLERIEKTRDVNTSTAMKKALFRLLQLKYEDKSVDQHPLQLYLI